MGSRGKFWKGQIVRRKVNGSPIGPYLQVTSFDRKYIWAQVVNSKEPNNMFLRKDIYTYTQHSLCISDALLKNLNKGNTICAQHTVNVSWKRVYENPPELIRFYTQQTGYESTFVLENVQKTLSLNEPVIRIIVDNKIVLYENSKTRTVLYY